MTETRTFTIALQEGFQDDTVILSAAGTIIERIDHVTTRNQIGLARELTISVPMDVTAIKIALPAGGIEKDVILDAAASKFIGVSLDTTSRRLIVRRSTEPFGYL